jgi:hypothetical protein
MDLGSPALVPSAVNTRVALRRGPHDRRSAARRGDPAQWVVGRSVVAVDTNSPVDAMRVLKDGE